MATLVEMPEDSHSDSDVRHRRSWLGSTLAVASLVLLLIAIVHVVFRKEFDQLHSPVREPPRSPFAQSIVGVGVVESETENIPVGAPVPGVVSEVFVAPGQQVCRGEPLFRLDDRQLQAQLQVTAAEMLVVRLELEEMESRPRPEEIAVAEARVRRAESLLANAQDEAQRLEKLLATNSVSQREVFASQHAVRAAKADLEQQKSELELIQNGTWAPELTVQKARVAAAEVKVEALRVDIDRLMVRAAIKGEVLQVHVRPGQFVSAPPAQDLIILGSTHRLHVRVEIDEHYIAQFRGDAKAEGCLRGDPMQKVPLEFVRLEPLVFPRHVISGLEGELVDTRTLQLVFRVSDRFTGRLLVGQQLDIFIDRNFGKP